MPNRDTARQPCPPYPTVIHQRLTLLQNPPHQLRGLLGGQQILSGLQHREETNVVVGFDIGNLRFDNQVEIEGSGSEPFSDGGDSGSLIVGRDRRGVALLFAGSNQGGENGQGLTYGNPLRSVLDALKVDLAL